jgi:K+-transporting ATPase KdpF subunit
MIRPDRCLHRVNIAARRPERRFHVTGRSSPENHEDSPWRTKDICAVNIENIVGLIVSGALAVYLIVAIRFPEWF